jgi:hypothetical protein
VQDAPHTRSCCTTVAFRPGRRGPDLRSEPGSGVRRAPARRTTTRLRAERAHCAITERLIANHREVLEALDPDTTSAGPAQVVLDTARHAVVEAGGLDGEFADILAVRPTTATTTRLRLCASDMTAP